MCRGHGPGAAREGFRTQREMTCDVMLIIVYANILHTPLNSVEADNVPLYCSAPVMRYFGRADTKVVAWAIYLGGINARTRIPI